MKPNLLLLHGALGSAEQLKDIASSLSSHFKIHSFNFSGHGGEPSETEYSIKTFSSEVLTYLKNHRLEEIDVFGYSMGGYVALQLAADYPGIIRRLVTLGTKFDWSPEAVSREVKMLNPAIIEKKVPKFAKSLEVRHHPLDWKLVMSRTAKMMERLGDGEALQRSQLEKITTQVYLGLGSHDQMVGISETEKVGNALSNSEMVILDGVPHPIEKADTEQVSNFILKSLQYEKS